MVYTALSQRACQASFYSFGMHTQLKESLFWFWKRSKNDVFYSSKDSFDREDHYTFAFLALMSYIFEATFIVWQIQYTPIIIETLKNNI